MATTVLKRSTSSTLREAVGTVTLGTYATGGQSFTGASLGLCATDSKLIWVDLVTNAGYYCEFDYTNQKIVVYRVGAVTGHTHDFLVKGGTAAGSTDVLNIKSLVIGKEEATDRTNTGGAAGGVQSGGSVVASALTEVSNGVDLSAVTVRFRAVA